MPSFTSSKFLLLGAAVLGLAMPVRCPPTSLVDSQFLRMEPVVPAMVVTNVLPIPTSAVRSMDGAVMALNTVVCTSIHSHQLSRVTIVFRTIY